MVPSRPPTPTGLNPLAIWTDGLQSFIVVLTGSLDDRRIDTPASIGNILHGMAELGERFDVGGVLVHHPGVAAGRFHHVQGLEEFCDIGGTIQTVRSFRRIAGDGLGLSFAFLHNLAQLADALLDDIGIIWCAWRRVIGGISRHGEYREERRLMI